MDLQRMKAFEFAQESTKQLLGLASAIIALTITFAKDFGGSAHPEARVYALISWGAFLASVLFGLWTLLALTGTLEPKQNGPPVSIRGKNITIPSVLQILTFFVGLLLTVVYGVKAAT